MELGSAASAPGPRVYGEVEKKRGAPSGSERVFFEISPYQLCISRGFPAGGDVDGDGDVGKRNILEMLMLGRERKMWMVMAMLGRGRS